MSALDEVQRLLRERREHSVRQRASHATSQQLLEALEIARLERSASDAARLRRSLFLTGCAQGIGRDAGEFILATAREALRLRSVG